MSDLVPLREIRVTFSWLVQRFWILVVRMAILFFQPVDGLGEVGQIFCDVFKLVFVWTEGNFSLVLSVGVQSGL